MGDPRDRLIQHPKFRGRSARKQQHQPQRHDGECAARGGGGRTGDADCRAACGGAEGDGGAVRGAVRPVLRGRAGVEPAEGVCGADEVTPVVSQRTS